ncbi:MAG: hypothetical protein AAF467_27385 [Actinomycetota bacterium]
MLEFFGSSEAEHYAAKLQLRFAPVFAETRTRDGIGAQLRSQIERLYGLFDEAGEQYPITTDVPDLGEVDWGRVADHVTIDKTW